MVRITARRAPIAAALFLAIIVTVAFSPQLENEFISVDDPLVITQNSHIVTGLNWTNIAWAFKSTHAFNWHPLTWISHMTDVQLFDLKPSGHHFTSLLIHVANAVLLFLLLRSLTGLVWASFFMSALFGVHPLRVESVAWAAERKDVLSVFFWVLTLVAYVKHVRRPNAGRYIAVLAAFGLALMSKPMVVTLPFVLLVLDYWPLGRMGRDQRGVALKRLVIEKIPLVAMALAAGTVTMFAQHSGGVVKTLHSNPLWIRVSNASLSYASYLWKMILPIDLYFPYPHPGSAVSLVKVGLSSIFLLAVTGLVLSRRKQSPFLLTGWFWYLGTLAPVIGLIQVAEQAMADRYTYMPSVGIVLAVVVSIVHGRSILKRSAVILGSIAVVTLLGLTRRQITYWHDDATFFGRVVTLNPLDNVAKNNLGQALAKEGRDVQAIAIFQEVLRLDHFP